ncbi:MAG: hypothetical protein WC602_01640 [archaeon]
MVTLKRAWLRALARGRNAIRLVSGRRAKPKVPFVQPKFRQGINPQDYSFINYDGWTFFDGTKRHYPCLALRNGRGKPVFMLGYNDRYYSFLEKGKKKIMEIRYIQRERAGRYGLAESRLRSRQLQGKLGIFPSEFLLSEFIWENREKILGGQKVVINSGLVSLNPEVYKPLISRFFVPSKEFVLDDKIYYELGMQKRRVREALGLEK